jgi:hypothetical protein
MNQRRCPKGEQWWQTGNGGCQQGHESGAVAAAGELTVHRPTSTRLSDIPSEATSFYTHHAPARQHRHMKQGPTAVQPERDAS